MFFSPSLVKEGGGGWCALLQLFRNRRHDPFDDELMRLFVVVEQIKIVQIKGRAEPGFAALTKTREAPAIESAQGHRDDDRAGIVNQLANAAIPFSQRAIRPARPFRKEHDLLGLQQFTEDGGRSHIAPPFDRESAEGKEEPTQKGMDEEFFFGRRPDHLAGLFFENGPGEEDGFVAGDMISGKEDAPLARDMFAPLGAKAITAGGVEADGGGDEGYPESTQE